MKIIPNSFQHPNFYTDVLDEYLTSDESKVMTHAIREILGWEPQVSLDNGLKNLVDWYLKERSWARLVATP